MNSFDFQDRGKKPPEYKHVAFDSRVELTGIQHVFNFSVLLAA